MKGPTTLEALLERLAVVDEQIDQLKQRLAAAPPGSPPAQALEQTLRTLEESKAALWKLVKAQEKWDLK
jgi:hypothetical protein